MRKTCLILVVLVVLVASSSVMGCEEKASAFTIVDDLGRPVRIESTPERIISLGPSITEIIFALDLNSPVP